jgi:hypothetical protein
MGTPTFHNIYFPHSILHPTPQLTLLRPHTNPRTDPDNSCLTFKPVGLYWSRAKLSQAKVLTGGGYLHKAQVDIPIC